MSLTLHDDVTELGISLFENRNRNLTAPLRLSLLRALSLPSLSHGALLSLAERNLGRLALATLLRLLTALVRGNHLTRCSLLSSRPSLLTLTFCHFSFLLVSNPGIA